MSEKSITQYYGYASGAGHHPMRDYTSTNQGFHRIEQEKAVRAVLFDRDGVLTYFDVDAANAFFRALLPISVFEIAARWQDFGTTSGFPRSLHEESQFFTSFWRRLGDEFSLDAQQRACLSNLDYTHFIQPFPEVRAVIEQLYAAGVRLGVLSNFTLASLEQSLVTLNLATYFTAICAAPVIGASKPSARAYAIAIDALKVRPEQCFFFDDEIECVLGACKFGLRSFLVDRQACSHDLDRGIVTDLRAVPLLALAG